MLIHTTDPIGEIWRWLGFLEIPANARRVLKERVEADFHGLDHKRLLALKKDANSRSPGRTAEFEVINPSMIEEYSEKLASCVTQAREIYSAAQDVTEASSPILQFYGMEHLGKALINATYKFRVPQGKRDQFYSHGLKIDRADYEKVTVRPLGIFPRVHDCYSSEPKIYLDGLNISLKELLGRDPDITLEFSLVYDQKPMVSEQISRDSVEWDVDRGKFQIQPYQGVNLTHIDVEYLAMFILSNKARYKPETWIKELGSDVGFLYKSFLNKSLRRFPNLILNQIWGREFLFATIGRIGSGRMELYREFD
jgi:hypothetical protein